MCVFEFSLIGLGTDEQIIIKILAHRNAEQRKLIREAYAAAYGEDLLKDLEKELSGDFLVSSTFIIQTSPS